MHLVLFLLSLAALAASRQVAGASEESAFREVSNQYTWFNRDDVSDGYSGSKGVQGHNLLVGRTCDAIFGLRSKDTSVKRYRLKDYDSTIHERFLKHRAITWPLREEVEVKNNLVIFYHITPYTEETERTYEHAAATIYTHLVSGAFKKGDYVTLIYGPYFDKRERENQLKLGTNRKVPCIGIKIMRAEDACYAFSRENSGKSLLRDTFRVTNYVGPMYGTPNDSSMRLLVTALQRIQYVREAENGNFDCEKGCKYGRPTCVCNPVLGLRDATALGLKSDLMNTVPWGHKLPASVKFISRTLKRLAVRVIKEVFAQEGRNIYMLVFYDPASDALSRKKINDHERLGYCPLGHELLFPDSLNKSDVHDLLSSSDGSLLDSKPDEADLLIASNKTIPSYRLLKDLYCYEFPGNGFGDQISFGSPEEFSLNKRDIGYIVVRHECWDDGSISGIKARLLVQLAHLRVRYFLAMSTISEYNPMVLNSSLYSERYKIPDLRVSLTSTRCRSPLFDASVSYGRPNFLPPGTTGVIQPLHYYLRYSDNMYPDKGIKDISYEKKLALNLFSEFDDTEAAHYRGMARLIGRKEDDLYGNLSSYLNPYAEQAKSSPDAKEAFGDGIRTMVGLSIMNFTGDFGELSIRTEARHNLFLIHFALTHSNFPDHSREKNFSSKIRSRMSFFRSSSWRELDMYDFIFNKRCPGAGSTVNGGVLPLGNKYPFYCSADDGSNHVATGVYTWYIPPTCGSNLGVDIEARRKLSIPGSTDFNCVTKSTTYDPEPLCAKCNKVYGAENLGICKKSKLPLPVLEHPSISVRNSSVS